MSEKTICAFMSCQTIFLMRLNTVNLSMKTIINNRKNDDIYYKNGYIYLQSILLRNHFY